MTQTIDVPTVKPVVDERDAEIARLTAQVAEANALVDRANEATARVAKDYEEHLVRIGQHFKYLAVEHDWCGVAEQGAEEVGIPWPDEEMSSGTVHLRINMTARPSDRYDRGDYDGRDEFFRRSIQTVITDSDTWQDENLYPAEGSKVMIVYMDSDVEVESMDLDYTQFDGFGK